MSGPLAVVPETKGGQTEQSAQRDLGLNTALRAKPGKEENSFQECSLAGDSGCYV